MPNYTLDLSDFLETEFLLIGIKTSLEDYRLAFLLNSHLNTYFTRKDNNLDIEIKNEKQSYSLFNYSDKYNYKEWNLISNKFVQFKTNNQTSNLFSDANFNFNSVNYLIPEQKKFDYFIKITGGVETSQYQNLINTIKIIPKVDAVFDVDPEELKSKDYLIF